MTVKTKSIFEPIEEYDGLRILITRFYPRGVKKSSFNYWVRELSPSATLLFEYKHRRCSWQDFKKRFLIEIYNNIANQDAINSLHEYSKSNDITLLCYERNGLSCHRHLVRDIIENPQLLLSFKPENTNNHKRT